MIKLLRRRKEPVDPCKVHGHQLGPPVPLECVPTGNGGHTTITLMPCARCEISVEFGDNSRALTPPVRHDFVQGLRERGVQAVLANENRY